MNKTYIICLFACLAIVSRTGVWAMSQFMIVSQADWAKKQGFYLSLESQMEGQVCRTSSLRLILAVADGKEWAYLPAAPTWQYDHDYQVTATINSHGARLSLDTKEWGAAQTALERFKGPLVVNSQVPWASEPADYMVAVKRVELTAGSAGKTYNFEKEAGRPVPLMMFEPQAPVHSELLLKPREPLSIKVTFRLVRYPDLTTYAPYVDRYGQCRYAEWPGKVRSDDDLKKSASEEERKLRQWGEPTGYDRFGGCRSAGWKETATGYFHVVRRNGYCWLISPEGNPCFYVGLCTVPSLNWEQTPVSDREFLFEWLPPKDAPYDAAWGGDSWGDPGTRYVALRTANLIRKYGAGWLDKGNESTRKRLKCWGFSGVGKWGVMPDLPVTPVLQRAGIPNLVRHPDIFDPAVRGKFEEVLRKQIEPRMTDPMVVGWSVGNEFEEIITADETRKVLQMPEATPCKRTLIDQALKETYKSNISAMAAAWGVSAASADDLYASQPKPPAADVETLRRFYASAYYEFIYKTIKAIDPNHLYFGFWIVPGWWENEEDWRVSAPFCDVIGYDLYSYDHSDERLVRLAKESGKPIFCGEFSFPAWYSGTRGYGVYPVFAGDDADSGGKYARWMKQAALDPLCIGAMWFHYRDQDLTGRGPGRGKRLVYGEHYAFGAVDITDRPKWPLVERMRETNLSAAKWRLDATAASAPPRP